MQGVLSKNESGWVVTHIYHEQNTLPVIPLPVLPEQQSTAHHFHINGNCIFDVVDEFTNPELYKDIPWGDGMEYAKLKN